MAREATRERVHNASMNTRNRHTIGTQNDIRRPNRIRGDEPKSCSRRRRSDRTPSAEQRLGLRPIANDAADSPSCIAPKKLGGRLSRRLRRETRPGILRAATRNSDKRFIGSALRRKEQDEEEGAAFCRMPTDSIDLWDCEGRTGPRPTH